MIDPNQNYTKTIAELTSTTDLLGNILAVGDRVRSFDFPMLVEHDCNDKPLGRVFGLDLKGGARFAYIEGTILAIDFPHPNHNCRSYMIQPDSMIYGGGEDAVTRCYAYGAEPIYAPVNGTPSLNHNTFGVVRIDENREKVLRRIPDAYLEARLGVGGDYAYMIKSPISSFAVNEWCEDWSATPAEAWEKAEYMTARKPEVAA